MALENPSFRILEENCVDYKERRELYALLENNAVDVGGRMVTDLYGKTLEKSNIDFGDIPNSRGDIEKCNGYVLMSSTLSVLKSLAAQGKVNIPQIMVIENAINNIKVNKNSFERAFAMNADMLIIYYNSLVYSCIEATSILITNFVDFTKNPNKMEMVIKKGNVDASIGQIAFGNLDHFNKMCKTGEFTKLSAQLTTGTASKEMSQVVSESIMGTVGTGILIASALIPLLRSVIYHYYYSRMRITDYLEQQSYFLQMNESNIQSSISDARKRKEIIKKQKQISTRFEDIADKIRINEKVVNKKVSNEIKNENKQWTLDTVKTDTFGIL